MKIAFVYDRVNKFGGAERVLLALHEIWPQAPLYTAVYDREKAKWADVFRVKPSFLHHFPLLTNRHEVLPLITPFVFESFNFDSYDVVLSITSADGKGIITKPEILHICYLLTPTRYLWSGYREYLREPGVEFLNPIARFFMKLFFIKLRQWDFIASQHPDVYIAISNHVRGRIKTYYKKDAQVIYPPVEIEKFKPSYFCRPEDPPARLPDGTWPAGGDEGPRLSLRSSRDSSPATGGFRMTCNKEYYLIVSRLVPYKRIDYVIGAFNKLGWKLKIIGRGIDESRLKNLAGRNVEFLGGDLTDEKLCWYYQNCKALIFPGEEDFGLTAAEVQACGKPAVVYCRGGARESIIPDVTGQLYEDLTEGSLIRALKIFERKHFLQADCCRNAERFAKLRFQKQIKSTVEFLWQEHKRKL